MTSIKLKPINEQVVVVVGASSGIGRETALQFARKGAKVVIASRSLPGMQSLLDQIEKMGGTAIVVPADVADYEQVKAIADRAIEAFGRIDSWVHVAATGLFAFFEEIKPEEFKRVVEVNFLGQVYGAMVALPHLRREGRGALIHVTSVEAHRSLPLQSAYSSSKHGVEGFLDSLRVELLHEGVPISVTNVMPATINTPFYNKGMTKLGVKPTGVPPYYQPELVAEAILHVAEHPTRDIIVGDVGRILDVAQKVAPGLVDLALAAIAIPGQRTTEIKTDKDPNNLYGPAEDPSYDRVEGDFGHLAIPSFLEALDFNPVFKWGAVAGLGVLTAVAGQIFGDKNSES